MYTPAECSRARQHHHLIHARVIYSIAAAHLQEDGVVSLYDVIHDVAAGTPVWVRPRYYGPPSRRDERLEDVARLLAGERYGLPAIYEFALSWLEWNHGPLVATPPVSDEPLMQAALAARYVHPLGLWGYAGPLLGCWADTHTFLMEMRERHTQHPDHRHFGPEEVPTTRWRIASLDERNRALAPWRWAKRLSTQQANAHEYRVRLAYDNIIAPQLAKRGADVPAVVAALHAGDWHGACGDYPLGHLQADTLLLAGFASMTDEEAAALVNDLLLQVQKHAAHSGARLEFKREWSPAGWVQ